MMSRVACVEEFLTPSRDEDNNIIVRIGDSFFWRVVGGGRYDGVIIEIDNGTAMVKCSDGITRAVQI